MPTAIVGPLLLLLVGVGGGGYAVFRWFSDKERERPELARGGGRNDGIDAAFDRAIRATPEEIVKATEREQAVAKEAEAAKPKVPTRELQQDELHARPPATKPNTRELRQDEYHNRPPPKKAKAARSRIEEIAERAKQEASANTTTNGTGPARRGTRPGRRP